MMKWEEFNERTNNMYIKHKRAVIAGISLVAILAFIIGFANARSVYIPITDKQFEHLETVAHEVYNQLKNGQVAMDIPDDVSVDVPIATNATSINVKMSNIYLKGSVVGKIENGKFETTRIYASNVALFLQIILGLICSFLATLLSVFIFKIYFKEDS